LSDVQVGKLVIIVFWSHKIDTRIESSSNLPVHDSERNSWEVHDLAYYA